MQNTPKAPSRGQSVKGNYSLIVDSPFETRRVQRHLRQNNKKELMGSKGDVETISNEKQNHSI